jgi:hypothetical protein
MTGTSDDGREDGTRRVITSEAGLAHSGAIVNDESSDFVFHDSFLKVRDEELGKERRRSL